MIVFALIALLLAIGFPYLWGSYHCMRMLRRLKRVGEENGFRFCRLRRFGIRNFSPYYDFSLIGENTVYLVQLLVCYHRGRELVIGSNGQVCQRSVHHAPLNPRKNTKKRVDGRWKAVPKTRLPKSVDTQKRVIPVLLNYPTYASIYLQKDRETTLYQGEQVFEKIILSPSALEKRLLG
jgi:hypothetical protein